MNLYTATCFGSISHRKTHAAETLSSKSII
jgi:hypothetical protein